MRNFLIPLENLKQGLRFLEQQFAILGDEGALDPVIIQDRDQRCRQHIGLLPDRTLIIDPYRTLEFDKRIAEIVLLPSVGTECKISSNTASTAANSPRIFRLNG